MSQGESPPDPVSRDLLPGVSVQRGPGKWLAIGARIKAWTGLEPEAIVADPELLFARVAAAQAEAVRAAWDSGAPLPSFWLSDERGQWREVLEFPGEEGWSIWLAAKEVGDRACPRLGLRQLGQMAGGVVHEVNNPLAGVMNYVRVARRVAKGDERLEEFLAGAEEEADRILAITRVLTELTPRPEGEVAHPVAPGAILRRVLLLTRTQLRDAGLRYRIEPSENLPPVRDAQHGSVLALLGILEDTTQRAAQGTEVVLRCEERGQRVALVVEDGVERPQPQDLGAAGHEGAVQALRSLQMLGGELSTEAGRAVLLLPPWSD
jgi:signal transduction histidine kinase